MGGQQFCTEERVREIVKREVNRSVIAYEKNIGGPRHEANQKLINKVVGGITVLKFMGSAALAIITVYIAWRHH